MRAAFSPARRLGVPRFAVPSLAAAIVTLTALAVAAWSPPAAAACTAGTALANLAESTPDGDFVDLDDGTVAHLKTGLIWKRCAEGQSWTGAGCVDEPSRLDWGAALRVAADSRSAGADDWRLPDRKELESLVEFCGHTPAINQTRFPPTPSERFWTSTSFSGDARYAWDVYFADGYSGFSHKVDSAQLARLVRTAPAGALRRQQTLRFEALPASIAVGAVASVVARSSAGLPVLLRSATPTVCAVNGDALSGLAEGACGLVAEQAGDAVYYPAPRLEATVPIGRRPQTIALAGVATLAVGDSATFTASASSGLPVTLATTTPGVCVFAGTRLRGLADGACTVVGAQDGDATYLPAPPVHLGVVVGNGGIGGGDGGGGAGDGGFSYPLKLAAGWHLLGHGVDRPLAVAARFADLRKVESVWAWRPERSTWAFFTPRLNADELRGFLAARGFEALTEIRPGEAYWLKLAEAHDFGVERGAPVSLTLASLRPGWNLVSTGDDIAPAALNLALAPTPPEAGQRVQSFVSLWAWDATRGRWYFYSPQFASAGELKAWAEQRGFFDFASDGRKVGKGAGFWIRK